MKQLYHTLFTLLSNIVLSQPIDADRLRVVPNPSNGFMRVELLDDSVEVAEIEVYNILGRKVHHQYSSAGSPMPVDISAKPEGVYLLRIKSGSQSLTRKIIIE